MTDYEKGYRDGYSAGKREEQHRLRALEQLIHDWRIDQKAKHSVNRDKPHKK